MNYKSVQKIKHLNKSKLFLVGLILKLLIIFSFKPYISHDLFLPFIKNFIENLSIDPWSSFLNNSGNINSFPYGITMLIGYLPLSLVGHYIDQNIIDLNLFEIGFQLTSLVYDYLLLIILYFLTRNISPKLLLLTYWLSPIVIYHNYIHGQIDILPISLLIASVLLIKNKKIIFSGILLSISVVSKFSILIALPFICIYIIKRNGCDKFFIKFLMSFLFSNLILFFPYFISSGFNQMVLGTREINRLYYVYVNYGNDLKLYIIPLAYLFSLFLILRIKRITQDLFILSLGLGFLSIIVFLPPAPAWSIWIVPFLVFYQIISKKDLLLITLFYSLVVILNTIYLSDQSNINLFISDFNYQFLNEIKDDKKFHNIVFTIQQSISFLLTIRIYIYGLKRNNFYSINDQPILISVRGNNIDLQNDFNLSIQKLLNKRELKIIDLEDFSSKDNLKIKELNINEKYSKQKVLYDKIPYYANHVSQIIETINYKINNNNKDFVALINTENIKLDTLEEKIDIEININEISKENNKSPSFEDIYKNTLFFIFQLNSINQVNKKILITYFPIGYLHKKLFNLFISISSLKVDIELLNEKRIVKMTIEGEPSKEDIYQIANSLIKEKDDLFLNDENWYSGYVGIMQLIFIANLSKKLQKR